MLDDQSRQFFQNWYKSDLGRSVLALELAEMAAEIDSTVGYYLVIQSPLKDIKLEKHRLRESILIAPLLEFGAPCHTVVARASELPFEADGVDVHIFHHALDISAMPHDDLREAARTLLPSGKLIIVGFNPWSLWGLCRVFSKRIKAPWCGQFIAHQRLEDWLKVAGLTLETKRFVYYDPPLQSSKWRSHFQWLGKVLRPLKLPFSGVYVMTATKQVKRHIPLKPRWSGARVRVPPLSKPTVKEMKE
ncbi:methyltransferase domain-containing protein [Marinomonas sp. M1K-6]|uniref:Methyltransferase domain-containing protein n=1 Tax=Marinomonas profundi TaxID=2726122 RepID=A0A847R6Y5_9GAMM|nr:methyltransferase domain-containing protein [Marinomonas profundi]NLQ16030.1 methyltransferase domain-containing protein [Marinomonas profundi]UDV03378.1 methyltransferase domain-containing protein [Marinomonas profundi]